MKVWNTRLDKERNCQTAICYTVTSRVKKKYLSSNRISHLHDNQEVYLLSLKLGKDRGWYPKHTRYSIHRPSFLIDSGQNVAFRHAGVEGAESSEICPGCVKLHQQARRGEKINTIESGRVTKRFRKQIKDPEGKAGEHARGSWMERRQH